MFFTPTLMDILIRERQRELEGVVREEQLLQPKRPTRPVLFKPDRKATPARSVS